MKLLQGRIFRLEAIIIFLRNSPYIFNTVSSIAFCRTGLFPGMNSTAPRVTMPTASSKYREGEGGNTLCVDYGIISDFDSIQRLGAPWYEILLFFCFVGKVKVRHVRAKHNTILFEMTNTKSTCNSTNYYTQKKIVQIVLLTERNSEGYCCAIKLLFPPSVAHLARSLLSGARSPARKRSSG